MKSDRSFVDYIVEQAQDAGRVLARAMFGGYTLYCDGKPVGLICDDQLFIKPTDAGEQFVGPHVEKAPPYQGARPCFLIEENIDDREWITDLVTLTCKALPERKPKGRKRRVDR